MKMNKKLVVATLSTVMGVGLVGSISGTVAWYQYSTRSKTSLIGTEVNNSGTIMLSTTGQENSYHSRLWTNDIFNKTSVTFNQVTFGKLNNDGSLPSEARLQPELGYGDFNDWDVAVRGKDYVQFNLYVRALSLNSATGLYERVAKDVYLTDIFIEDLESSDGKDVSDAVRVHFQNRKDATDNRFLSKNAVANQKMGGTLDMDDDGFLDKDRTDYDYAEDEAHSTAPVCKYGQYNGDDPVEQVTTKSIAETKASKDANGDLTDTTGKFHVTTLDAAGYAANSNEDVCYQVTIWLEGWHVFSGATDAMWDIDGTHDATFHVGFIFDAGDNVFDA